MSSQWEYQVGHSPIGTGIELDQLLWKGLRLPASFIERATCLPPEGDGWQGGGSPAPAPLRRGKAPTQCMPGMGFHMSKLAF